MTRHNLIQGSEEWLLWRRLGGPDNPRDVTLTASEFAAAIGLSPYMTTRDLFEVKLHIRAAPAANAIMERGHALEPLIRDEVNRRLQRDYQPACVSSDTMPYALASLDGLQEDAQPPLLEIKLVGQDAFAEIERGVIPPAFQAQMIAQCGATGFSSVLLAAYGGNPWGDFEPEKIALTRYSVTEKQVELYNRIVELFLDAVEAHDISDDSVLLNDLAATFNGRLHDGEPMSASTTITPAGEFTIAISATLEKVKELEQSCIAFVVDSDELAAFAAKQRKSIGAMTKNLKEKRTQLLEPISAAKARVDEAHALFSGPLASADKALANKLDAWVLKKQAAARALVDAAVSAMATPEVKAAARAATAPAASKIAGAAIRTVVNFEIIDADAVPREYCSPDPAKIRRILPAPEELPAPAINSDTGAVSPVRKVIVPGVEAWSAPSVAKGR